MFVAIYLKWLDEIKIANKVSIPKHKEDGQKEFEIVKRINRYYVLPLTIFSAMLSLLILPEWVKIIIETCRVISQYSFDVKYYDIVSAIFLLIGAVSFVFTIHLLFSYYSLRVKTKQLNPHG